MVGSILRVFVLFVDSNFSAMALELVGLLKQNSGLVLRISNRFEVEPRGLDAGVVQHLRDEAHVAVRCRIQRAGEGVAQRVQMIGRGQALGVEARLRLAQAITM